MSYVEEPLLVEIGPKVNPATKRRFTIAEQQQARIDVGMHPLSGVGATPRRVLLLTPTGPTCGDCRNRTLIDLPIGDGYRTKRVPKCTFAAEFRENGSLAYAPRIANSQQTDCRAKWPACTDFQENPS
ncbi:MULTISPECIES: hypothetical protein [Glycomyces]|uniref:Uncharacterized protein n=2 Tax=Glycomyces TaxID=58113 RepID=A0ABU2AHV3_9ACTN|nr:hypothetical protein [Glycomyces lechevalierae]MDR7336788.1 hypothetical protein [Glycomyces lechevalierae]